MTAFIGNKDNARAEVKIKKSELKALEAKIEQETKPFIKQLFDYQIPIAQVEKAGITTTGAECENELEELLQEYMPYRKELGLWTSTANHYDYKVENNSLYKRLNNGEWEKIC